MFGRRGIGNAQSCYQRGNGAHLGAWLGHKFHLEGPSVQGAATVEGLKEIESDGYLLPDIACGYKISAEC